MTKRNSGQGGSPEVASATSKVLSISKAFEDAKQAAASALSHRPKRK